MIPHQMVEFVGLSGKIEFDTQVTMNCTGKLSKANINYSTIFVQLAFLKKCQDQILICANFAISRCRACGPSLSWTWWSCRWPGWPRFLITKILISITLTFLGESPLMITISINQNYNSHHNSSGGRLEQPWQTQLGTVFSKIYLSLQWTLHPKLFQ